MYPIGFGDEGAKNPIYCGDVQVALVKKPSVIVDDMYDFDIIVKDDSFLTISIIITSYLYAKAFFRPGEVIKKGIVKSLTVTSEKELISRYDDSFEKNY